MVWTPGITDRRFPAKSLQRKSNTKFQLGSHGTMTTQQEQQIEHIKTRKPAVSKAIFVMRTEWPLLVSVGTTIVYLLFGKWSFADLGSPAWFGLVLGWLVGAILVSAFAILRHAKSLAVGRGEAFGALVLTLSMSGIEMMMIAPIIYAGQGESSLARDTLLAILMIALNAIVGMSLLFGWLRHHEQSYSFYGANTLLAVLMPMSVLGLVLPTYMVSSRRPILSPLASAFLIVMSVVLYGVFLAIQIRQYFVSSSDQGTRADRIFAVPAGSQAVYLARYHILMMLVYAVSAIVLSKQIAIPIHYGIDVLGAPARLVGLLVAVLILIPVTLAALRAALTDQLEVSINLAIGAALSSIGLTIPAVLIIGFITDKSIILGLDAADATCLVLTLGVSMLTFAADRTYMRLGTVHLLLFLTYLSLLFDK
jgi:Ca2+:H+ antiporter